MKQLFEKSKGPVIFTDPCPKSPVSTLVAVLQTLALFAAIIVSDTKR